LALALGQPERAARLFGAGLVQLELSGANRVNAASRWVKERDLAATRAKLGEAAFARALATGRTLSLQEALAEADAIASDALARGASALPDGLTAREAELLALLAAGRTNHEIADALVLSVKTVERHLTNAYTKIGARNRADATAYALRHALPAP
jgi:DNA-binding NarL/FixJ family response regulator